MKKRTGKGKSPLAIMTVGVLVGLVASMALISLSAVFITKKDIPVHDLPIFLVLSGAFGCICSSVINARRMDQRGIIIGTVSALFISIIYLLVLLIVSKFSFSGWMAIILIADILAGMIGGIIAKNI